MPQEEVVTMSYRVQASNTYRSESNESNIAACIRNASRALRKFSDQSTSTKTTLKVDLGELVNRDNYIFPQGQRGRRMDEVSTAYYGTVERFRAQYTRLPVEQPLAKLQRAYDAWQLYRRRQGR
jgi:hypothetical protein